MYNSTDAKDGCRFAPNGVKTLRGWSLPALGVWGCVLLWLAGAAYAVDPSPRAVVSLDDEERAWIQAHPVVTFSVDDAYPPKNFRDERGQLAGVSIDYVRLLASRIGLEVRFEGSTWAQALAKALDHQVDGVINADLRDERKPYLNFTEVFATYPQALVVRKEEPPITDLSAFGSKRVAAKKDSSQLALLRERHPKIQTVPVDTLDEALDLLTEAKVDGIYDDVAVLHRIISQRFATNTRFALVVYEPPVGYARIGLDSTKPQLLSLFNKAIGSLTDSDHRAIQRAWIGLDLPKRVGSARNIDLTLTEEEENWLREHPVIRVAADPAYCPMEFADTTGNRRGLAIDYLERIEDTLRVRFEFTAETSWAKMLEMAQRREIDMFSCIANTPERRNYLVFTTPYFTLPIAVFSRADLPYVHDLSELEGKRVGVVAGYSSEEWLKRDHPGIALVRVPSIREGLQKLEAKAYDVFVDDILCGGYYLGELGYHDIKVAGLTPYSYDFCMATRNDWPILAEVIGKALQAIPPEDRNVMKARWLSTRYTAPFNFALLWEIGGGVLLGVLGLVAWNHHLRAQVQRRTLALTHTNESLSAEIAARERTEAEREKLIAELQEALTEVRTLAGLLPICSHCKKVRDDKGYWTQLERYVHEHSGTRFSHGICPSCIEELYPEYASRVLEPPPSEPDHDGDERPETC